MAAGRRLNTVRNDWAAGRQRAVLARAGYDTPTGGFVEAARLLWCYGWSDSTWINRSSQVRKWLTFADEDDRYPLPATEGDVLVELGFLSLRVVSRR